MNEYLDREQFYKEILKWKKDQPNNVGDYLILLANHILGKSNFRGYTKSQQDDMVSFALYKCVKGLKSFRRQKTIKEGGKKAYSYFTVIIHYAFYTELKKYYKRLNLNRELEEQYISNVESQCPELGRKMREDFSKKNLPYL